MDFKTGNIVELRGKKAVVVANPYEVVNCNLEVCYVILDKDGNLLEFINSIEALENITKEITAHHIGIADELT